jgi:hypothetical protein
MGLRPGLRRLLLPPPAWLLYSIPPLSPSPLRWRTDGWIGEKSPCSGGCRDEAAAAGLYRAPARVAGHVGGRDVVSGHVETILPSVAMGADRARGMAA